MSEKDTIAAIATPQGAGGVGIIRISGPEVPRISKALIGDLPKPRYAAFRRFQDEHAESIDEGIALYFPRPHSFTGEDVLELQGHGGPVVLDMVLSRVLQCGARIAHAGEFSKRAFLNGKLDLVQVEAVADLIEAGTAQAARLALRSLEGVFSKRVHDLLERLIHLRCWVEAAIDFPDEEIDFLSDGKVEADTRELIQALGATIASARTGRLLRDGIQLVIAGPPNAGKSSLLNALSGRESAIVTDIPGTTRDLLRERIQIDGIPVHIVDTAGLRHSDDLVEREGIRRAREELVKADLILWLIDERDYREHGRSASIEAVPAPSSDSLPVILVRNKIDLVGGRAGLVNAEQGNELLISAKNGEGLDLLRELIKSTVGGVGTGEGEFLARRRHLDALNRAMGHVELGLRQLQNLASGELLAEELRLSQQALSEITGEYSADDLLGEIFSGFCIGK